MNNMLLKTYVPDLNLHEFQETSQNVIIEYSCPLCEGILSDAVIDPCGHSFCFSCIQILIKNKDVCPYTGNALKQNNLIRNTVVNTIIEKQLVFCKNKASKCEWSGKLSQRKDHLLFECDKENLLCKFNCGEMFTREGITVHEAQCDFRIEECSFCKETVRAVDLKVHYTTACSNYPKQCSCGEAVPLSEFEDHIENLCEERVVSCPFGTVGCLFKDYRRIVREHIAEKTEYHMKILSSKIGSLEDIIYQQNTSLLNYVQQNDLLRAELSNMKASMEAQRMQMEGWLSQIDKNIDSVKAYSVIPFTNINLNQQDFTLETLDKDLFEFEDFYLTKVANNYGWYGVSFNINTLKNKLVINVKLENTSNNCIMVGINYSNQILSSPIVGGFYKNTEIESFMFYTFNHYTYRNGLLYSKGKGENTTGDNNIITVIVDFEFEKLVFKHNGITIEEITDAIPDLKNKQDTIRLAIDMTDSGDKIRFI